MATSSFFHDIVITDKETADVFVDALENAEKVAYEPPVVCNVEYRELSGDEIELFFKE